MLTYMTTIILFLHFKDNLSELCLSCVCNLCAAFNIVVTHDSRNVKFKYVFIVYCKLSMDREAAKEVV